MLLKHAKQFDLNGNGWSRHSRPEKSATRGELKFSDATLVGAGKGTFFVAESSLSISFRESLRSFTPTKGPFTWAIIVDALAHDSLPRSIFSPKS